MQKNISKKELREFGILIGIVFPLIIGWVIPFLYGHSFKSWTFIISIPSLLLAILSPRILFYPYKAWIKIGNFLGFINSHLILSIVYIFVLIPIATVMKFCNHDPLRKKQLLNKSYRETKKNYIINLEKIF